MNGHDALTHSDLSFVINPKMKILSSFTQVFPDLYECVCSAEHKGRYSEECGTPSSIGAPLTFSLTMEVNGAQNNLIKNFLQNIFLCVQQNKHIHTGLEILEDE